MKRFLMIFSALILALVSACNYIPGAVLPPTATRGANPSLTETPTETPSAGVNDDQFVLELSQAIEGKDFEPLRAMLASRFMLAYWRSEGREFSADEALAELQKSLLGPGSAPRVDTGVDLQALIGGADPLAFLGPEVGATRAFLVRGLGANAADEAIVLLARDPATGRLAWRGTLAASTGFQNGATGQPDSLGDLNAFSERLAQALQDRDFETLRSLMRDRFVIATWNTSLLEMDSDEALQQLSEGALADGAIPDVAWDSDTAALLGGFDPLTVWGPVHTPARAVHVTGLGPQAMGDAIAAISRDETTGQFYWHGILLPAAGTFTSQSPEPGAVVPSDIKQVVALEAVNTRSGPGMDYAVTGIVQAGEIAQVNEKSADGNWWQIVCTQDSSGFCWISADPSLTEPTN